MTYLIEKQKLTDVISGITNVVMGDKYLVVYNDSRAISTITLDKWSHLKPGLILPKRGWDKIWLKKIVDCNAGCYFVVASISKKDKEFIQQCIRQTMWHINNL